jgi:hypothetical protein
MTDTNKTRHVIITTEYRGVYFGELVAHSDRTAVIANARMAIYWGTENGVDQLANSGPTSKSKIGAKAPKVWLCGITSLVDCTPEAVKAWEKA